MRADSTWFWTPKDTVYGRFPVRVQVHININIESLQQLIKNPDSTCPPSPTRVENSISNKNSRTVCKQNTAVVRKHVLKKLNERKQNCSAKQGTSVWPHSKLCGI